MTLNERAILRNLAKRVAEVAELPIQDERRELWKRHNRLERVRPMILVFPEGSWLELLPEASLQCEDPFSRGMEWTLRSRLYHHEHFYDDTVIEKEWVVPKVVTSTGWGLDLREIRCQDPTGAWAFDPVIKVQEDLAGLRFPEIGYDEETTVQNFNAAWDVFGDILDVKLKGVGHVSFHLMNLYTRLRGLEQVFVDMYENPGMLHEAMAFLEEGHRRMIKQYQNLNLFSLNNDGTYHSSGGVGYTDELPHRDAGFDPDHIRPCDIWASAEAQEMDPVSPEMHDEFIMQYEKRLLEPFGLSGYGCCDDLSRKMDYVSQIPNIRRISIAPWADVDRSAERISDDYIFSWKPKPFHLVGTFDAQSVREYITHTLDVTQGCAIEMILKDTHTCEHHPERFTQWTEIARELVDQY